MPIYAFNCQRNVIYLIKHKQRTYITFLWYKMFLLDGFLGISLISHNYSFSISISFFPVCYLSLIFCCIIHVSFKCFFFSMSLPLPVSRLSLSLSLSLSLPLSLLIYSLCSYTGQCFLCFFFVIATLAAVSITTSISIKTNKLINAI